MRQTLNNFYIMKKAKIIKGEKYIYLLMGYNLAKANGGRATVGEDAGIRGGQHYVRYFKIQEYAGMTLLVEGKNTAGNAIFDRAFTVIGVDSVTPLIREYINEHGENESTRWTH